MLPYQKFADMCRSACAVLSVEKTDDGYGEIRIICANAPYKETMGPAYHDGMPYYELVPKDLKFEDFCYRSAILGQRLHTYVETPALGCWTDQQYTPLASDEEGVGYCQFMFAFTAEPDPELLSSVSATTATAVVKTVVTLLNGDDFQSGMEAAVSDILRQAGALAGRVMLLDHVNEKAINFCQYIADRDNPMFKRGSGEIGYGVARTWEDMIAGSNAVLIKDERDMEDIARRNPAWAADMAGYGIESLLLLPLPIRIDEFSGYLYAINFDTSRVVETKELFELSSFILGSEISNYLLLEKLDVLSKADALTGLYNRHAMHYMVREWDEEHPGEPFGIINVDVNGLKVVNDQDGHDAGDKLLVQASEILKKVFYEEGLFRTGGDEFIVIMTGADRDVFERKVGMLRSVVDKHDLVSFAIGDYWSDGGATMSASFAQADAKMYADKRAYYEQHPEHARR